jgi:hypothetical protein
MQNADSTYGNEKTAKAVLGPCGITTMAIAGDSLADRKSDEVTYEGHPFFGPPSISTAKSMYWNTKTSPIGFRFLEWTRMGAG